MDIIHHGAKTGVTGSCHELLIGNASLLVDCGLFQGNEAQRSLDIEFDAKRIAALLLTHCHIDHIGRLPWLLAAGFKGPIYATEATAVLLPLMLEDGLKIKLGLSTEQCQKFTEIIHQCIRPVPYNCWAQFVLPNGELVTFRFRPAGHILGSAYIEIKLPDQRIVVFSGNLGPLGTPLLADPVPPEIADTLVIESTYGDKHQHDIKRRSRVLKTMVERSLREGGAIIIPAFSVGLTQELLFDLENILEKVRADYAQKKDKKNQWQDIPIVLDSPLAQQITERYRLFHELWGKETKEQHSQGRHPLAFEQCITIDSHQEHLELVNRLRRSGEPAIIVAASDMCSGGRVVDYLEALLPNNRTDVIFADYQSEGTLGRTLYNGEKIVTINKNSVKVKAKIHKLSGYSAHAAQDDLLAFVAGIKQGPQLIRVVHGDLAAQTALAEKLREIKPDAKVIVAAID